MGSSLYITGVEVFAFAEKMLLRGDSIQRFRFWLRSPPSQPIKQVSGKTNCSRL
jgi:hypothetical protein